MDKRDLLTYTVFAAAALYGIDALAQRKMEFCNPAPSVAKMEKIASGAMNDRGRVYDSYKPDKQTIVTIISDGKTPREIVGYTVSTKIPNDPKNPDNADYRTDSYGCIKGNKKFRKVSLNEVVEKLSQ